MLSSTARSLRCPRLSKGKGKLKARCDGQLEIRAREVTERVAEEVAHGHLECRICHSRFPILAGVAVVVEDVRSYLLSHAKGLSRLVKDSEIPSEFQHDYREVKAEIQALEGAQHVEDDLEAERVTALYVMNHYLRVAGTNPERGWWKPRETGEVSGNSGSPLIDSLVRAHWDHGPMAWVQGFVSDAAARAKAPAAIELGCGVGGLCAALKPLLGSYLGVDSSFASIALARHLALGAPYRGKVRIPEDLLQGGVSRDAGIRAAKPSPGDFDFIVGDLENPPLARGQWDYSIALNAIDMLEDPAALPRLQHSLLKPGGTAIQSCPYIWHEQVARRLRSRLPVEIRDSARAVTWLYERAGFVIEKQSEHVPWLFFKHVRQLEVYDAHVFAARA